VTAIDLRGVLCPLTWVKARLALEALEPGDSLELLLDPGEAWQSVPRSAREEGHRVELGEGRVTIVKGSG
jgi:TusA-related sulfurtransferase